MRLQQRMMADGTVAELTRLRRLDARARQKLAAGHFVMPDPIRAYIILQKEDCQVKP
jgi:hypothetical protein